MQQRRSAQDEVRDYLTARARALTPWDALYDQVKGRSGAFLVVDTRSRPVFQQGHIEGAISLPATEVARLAAALPADRPLVTYGWSATWHPSTAAAAALAERGFVVSELSIGWQEWQAGGLPIHRGAATGLCCSCSW